MADQQVNLSDAELQEAVKAGWFQDNPALLNKLDSDSRRRFVRVKRGDDKQPTMGPDQGSFETTGLRGMFNKAFPPEKPRADSAIASGIPLIGSISPGEVVGGVGMGRAVVGAMGDTAATTGGRVLAGAKEVVTQTAPIVKYEATKHLLMSAGLPEPVAMPIAMAVSGYQPGKKGTAPPPETPAAPGSASVPTAPEVAPSPAPAPASAGPTKAPRAPRVGRASASASQTSDGFSLSKAEEDEAARWMAKGVPPEEILNRILMSRKLTSATGAPTPDEMRSAVDFRNTKGRWPDEQ
jgi:hypothetical protein